MHIAIRAVLLLISASGIGLAGVAAGCSSNGDASNATSAANICPSTLNEVATAHCREPFACNINYHCDSYLAQPAQCSCASGHFECKDSLGAAIADLKNPPCISPGTGNDDACPATEAMATGQICKTTGLVCTYASAIVCPQPGATAVDTCQCLADLAVDGNVVFRYNCEPRSCTDLIDGGPRDASDNADAGDTGPG